MAISSETLIDKALRQIMRDLGELKKKIALVGGLAVSVYVEPRFTRDVDLSVAVVDDKEAEKIINDLRARKYEVLAVIEQETTNRLATVRLIVPLASKERIVADLLFASSGIESEIVSMAEPLWKQHDYLGIAKPGHLIALKVLATSSNRPQDLVDLHALFSIATSEDLALAESSLRLIEQRGFSRDKDLQKEFAEISHAQAIQTAGSTLSSR